MTLPPVCQLVVLSGEIQLGRYNMKTISPLYSERDPEAQLRRGVGMNTQIDSIMLPLEVRRRGVLAQVRVRFTPHSCPSKISMHPLEA
jgi:hypothetical protein